MNDLFTCYCCGDVGRFQPFKLSLHVCHPCGLACADTAFCLKPKQQDSKFSVFLRTALSGDLAGALASLREGAIKINYGRDDSDKTYLWGNPTENVHYEIDLYSPSSQFEYRVWLDYLNAERDRRMADGEELDLPHFTPETFPVIYSPHFRAYVADISLAVRKFRWGAPAICHWVCDCVDCAERKMDAAVESGDAASQAKYTELYLMRRYEADVDKAFEHCMHTTGDDFWQWQQEYGFAKPVRHILTYQGVSYGGRNDLHVYLLENGQGITIKEQGCSCYESSQADIDVYKTVDLALWRAREWRQSELASIGPHQRPDDYVADNTCENCGVQKALHS